MVSHRPALSGGGISWRGKPLGLVGTPEVENRPPTLEEGSPTHTPTRDMSRATNLVL